MKTEEDMIGGRLCTKGRRVLFVVMLLLLVSASAASADCAWLMWMNGNGTLRGKTETVWEVYDTLDTQARCEARLPAAGQAMVLTLRESGEDARLLSGGTVRRMRKDGAEIFYRFQCLPDTIDPRGPKGGGR